MMSKVNNLRYFQLVLILIAMLIGLCASYYIIYVPKSSIYVILPLSSCIVFFLTLGIVFEMEIRKIKHCDNKLKTCEVCQHILNFSKSQFFKRKISYLKNDSNTKYTCFYFDKIRITEHFTLIGSSYLVSYILVINGVKSNLSQAVLRALFLDIRSNMSETPDVEDVEDVRDGNSNDYKMQVSYLNNLIFKIVDNENKENLQQMLKACKEVV